MFSAAAFRYRIIAMVLFVFNVFPLSAAMAQGGAYQGWHMGPGIMGSWGMGWFGGIFMIVFWILILLAFVFGIRWLLKAAGKNKNIGQSGSRAMDILKERYARGEIDKAQFEAMKQDLVNGSD